MKEETGSSRSLLAVLPLIYQAAAQNNAAFVCYKGCADCCTQSVTLSALEGEFLLQGLVEGSVSLPPTGCSGKRPELTTNQYVGQFFAGGEPADDTFWAEAICPFLEQGCCTIYLHRPFMCRSFVSQSLCRETGYAEVPPQLLSFNTIILQVLEHLSLGRPWGIMNDVLQSLSRGKDGGMPAERTLQCQPIPGFIFPPEERAGLRSDLANVVQVLEEASEQSAQVKTVCGILKTI